MGLFWDLIQQGQISEQRERARTLEQRSGSLEYRIAQLEAELRETRRMQQELLSILEQRFGEDLNRDGRIG